MGREKTGGQKIQVLSNQIHKLEPVMNRLDKKMFSIFTEGTKIFSECQGPRDLTFRSRLDEG